MGLLNRLSRRKNKVFSPTYLPRWQYLGGERLVLDSAARTCTLPANTEIFVLVAEGGDIYYSINTLNASANSSGYVPQNGGVAIGPLSNLTQLSVYGAAASRAHLQYFLETN